MHGRQRGVPDEFDDRGTGIPERRDLVALEPPAWFLSRERPALLHYLALTVLATITLYYELYVGGSVSTLILTHFHMTFTFYVIVLAFGNLIGAFGSLLAGLTDRLGRANLVVAGLFLTAIFTLFILPAAPNKWAFSIEGFIIGTIEGICLVATPALIRDFSPQVGRATAMGFWTSGPVLGSLIVAVVGSATIPAVVTNPGVLDARVPDLRRRRPGRVGGSA